jgi:NAD(P)H dehydrogenase (quinone)
LVALARTPAKGADLGIEVREADYDRPATLARALDGIDTLLMISASEIGKRQAQHHKLIEAAKQHRVGRIVYTSLLRADTSPIGLAQEHLATETELKATGIPLTILRNGWYTENYTGAIPPALAHGAFIGCAGAGRISGAARRDYAEAAAVALAHEAHIGQTYELAGDTAFTLAELAAEVSRQTGQLIVYKDLPPEQYAQALMQAGVPGEMARVVAAWDVDAAHGALFDDGHQLSRLIARPTTPLAAVVKDALPSR